MPLKRGAKPGSAGFKANIRAEVAAGKPDKQAVAIAYSEAKEHPHRNYSSGTVTKHDSNYPHGKGSK